MKNSIFKRIISAVVCGMILVVLSACDSTNTSSGSTGSNKNSSSSMDEKTRKNVEKTAEAYGVPPEEVERAINGALGKDKKSNSSSSSAKKCSWCNGGGWSAPKKGETPKEWAATRTKCKKCNGTGIKK